MKPRSRKTAKPAKTSKATKTAKTKPAGKPAARRASVAKKKRPLALVSLDEFTCTVSWDDAAGGTSITVPYLLTEDQADEVVLFLEKVVTAGART